MRSPVGRVSIPSRVAAPLVPTVMNGRASRHARGSESNAGALQTREEAAGSHRADVQGRALDQVLLVDFGDAPKDQTRVEPPNRSAIVNRAAARAAPWRVPSGGAPDSPERLFAGYDRSGRARFTLEGHDRAGAMSRRIPGRPMTSAAVFWSGNGSAPDWMSATSAEIASGVGAATDGMVTTTWRQQSHVARPRRTARSKGSRGLADLGSARSARRPAGGA